MQTAEPKPARPCARRQIASDERLLLNLYCAERIAEGPGQLSLSKIWIPFDPHDRESRDTRGYYVLYTLMNRVHYRRYGLTERAHARACFEALADRALHN